MIKLIIFDLWQTLADRDIPNDPIWDMMKVTNISLDRVSFTRLSEKSLQTKKWDSKNKAYTQLCKDLGIPTTDANVKAMQAVRDKIERHTVLFVFVIELLTKLRSKGYKIGLISNSSIFAFESVRDQTNLLDYIDYPVFSFQVGAVKPDPKIYKKFLEVSKVKPEETLMIGDKLQEDVMIPRSLGFNAIQFKDYQSLIKEFKKFSIFI